MPYCISGFSFQMEFNEHLYNIQPYKYDLNIHGTHEW